MKKRTLIAVLAAASMNFAYAADDHKGHNHAEHGQAHAHEAKAQHGGTVAVVNDVNLELVTQPDTVALYVSDHGKPLDVSGGSASVTILSGAEKINVKLSPAGANRLEAKGSYKVGPGAKAVAVVKLAGQPVTTVRYTLK